MQGEIPAALKVTAVIMVRLPFHPPHSPHFCSAPTQMSLQPTETQAQPPLLKSIKPLWMGWDNSYRFSCDVKRIEGFSAGQEVSHSRGPALE